MLRLSLFLSYLPNTRCLRSIGFVNTWCFSPTWCFFLSFWLFQIELPCFQLCFLSFSCSEVVQLCFTNFCPFHYLYLIDQRRVKRKDPFNANSLAYLSHGDSGTNAFPVFSCQHQTLKYLDSFLFSILDLLVYLNCISWPNFRDFFLRVQCVEYFSFSLHGLLFLLRFVSLRVIQKRIL